MGWSRFMPVSAKRSAGDYCERSKGEKANDGI